MWDVATLRQQFPALSTDRQVYFDFAATTQIPMAVLAAMAAYERQGRGNPYRGLHAWAAKATEFLQSSRATVAGFVGARPEELLFTKSTTEGLNLVARSLGKKLGPGDEVVLTIFEHHANLLPWRELARELGFTLQYLPMSDDGGIDLALAKTMITAKTKVVALTLASNVLGTLLPVRELAKLAHGVGAWCVVDAAQAVARLPVHVRDLGCDALAFGAHKMYGPEGIGAVYVCGALQSHLQPLVYGGGMVDEVLDDDIRYADDVRLFEAGSPNVTGAVGFAAACTFLQELDVHVVRAREQELVARLVMNLQELPRVQVFSPEPKLGRVGVVSFAIDGVHSHDVAQLLADRDIAVRAGYHCAAPLTRCLAPEGTVRVSLGVTSTEVEIDRLIVALQEILARFPV